MKTSNRNIILVLAAVIFASVSCERDFDIELPGNESQMIVEAYINNELPLFNYVILGRSQDYFSTGFENVPVSGAIVTITEGIRLPNNTYLWDSTTKKQLQEGVLPQFGNVPLPGVYFDSALITNSPNALLGKPGKHYLLEIDNKGQRYSAITALLPIIPLDSLTAGDHYIDTDNDTTQVKARITIHYKDPDTIGNTNLYYWRHSGNRRNFGWGGIGTNSFTPNTDDLTNGQNMHVTIGNGFEMDDSVNFYMASVERKVYNFWDSYRKARQNGGPFSTPVTLQNTIQGDNVIGCFSGFSISTRSIIIK